MLALILDSVQARAIDFVKQGAAFVAAVVGLIEVGEVYQCNALN